MIAFASLCIFGAILTAVGMMVTTPRASVRAARHDPQAMWGMLRRLFYLSIAGGNMGVGLWVFNGWVVLPPSIMIFWLMAVMPVGLFLILRATKLIDQDYWIGKPRRRGAAPRTVHEVADEWRDIARNINNPVRRAQALRAASDLDNVAS